MPDYQVVKDGKLVTLPENNTCGECGCRYAVRPGWDNHFLCSNACMSARRRDDTQDEDINFRY